MACVRVMPGVKAAAARAPLQIPPRTLSTSYQQHAPRCMPPASSMHGIRRNVVARGIATSHAFASSGGASPSAGASSGTAAATPTTTTTTYTSTNSAISSGNARAVDGATTTPSSVLARGAGMNMMERALELEVIERDLYRTRAAALWVPPGAKGELYNLSAMSSS